LPENGVKRKPARNPSISQRPVETGILRSAAGGKSVAQEPCPDKAEEHEMNSSIPEGTADLAALLRSMRPVLREQPFIFASVPRESLARLAFAPLGTFCESEGVTVIAEQGRAREEGWPAEDAWACITLTVHSSLHAVGFLAAVAAALAREGISVNPVSAYYHDHLFVPWDRRKQAVQALVSLSEA
jgi:hypothetical protein